MVKSNKICMKKDIGIHFVYKYSANHFVANFRVIYVYIALEKF